MKSKWEIKMIIESDVCAISQSPDSGRFYWEVRNVNTGLIVEIDSCTSYDQAERNARSFIRNNQNKIYG